MNKKIFVIGGDYNYEEMFKKNGWEVVSFEEADFVQFTGGEDVSPSIYGERNVAAYSSHQRDLVEVGYFVRALALGKNMLGICRGGQFLTAMSGHRLWQDVDKHGVGGTHTAIVVDTGEEVQVSSTHHQMFRLREGYPAEVLVVAGRSTSKESSEGKFNTDPDLMSDLESVFYPHTKALAFQPHPEFFNKDHECQKLYFSLIQQKFQ